MKRIIAILFILSLLATTNCKKKDDDTSPTAPKTTLADRVGVYTGSAIVGANEYNSIVEIKDTGNVLINAVRTGNSLVALPTKTILDTKSEETSFTLQSQDGVYTWGIVFKSKTTLELKETAVNMDLGILTRQ